MLFMSLRTIRGWFTAARFILGRDGIPTPGFGLAARTFRSDSASESDGSAVLDGAGVTGDSIGMADTRFTVGAGTTP
jgi:hypothetical protein